MATLPKPATKPATTEDDVLDNGIIVLDTLGWTQKAFQKRDGTVCALGALQLATVNHGARRALYARRKIDGYSDEGQRLGRLYRNAQYRVKEAIIKFEARKRHVAVATLKNKMGFINIWAWNDQPGRTAEEVRQVFEIARKLK